MRLRSGRKLHYKKLPEILETYIKNGVQAIRNILPDKELKASELLVIIGTSENQNYRHYIGHKVNEIFDPNDRSQKCIQDRFSLSSLSG